jgi:uncharacterized membrane protein
VTLSGNTWQTVVTPTALALTAQTSATIQVSVTVPVTALAGMTDAVNVTATSQGDGAQSVQLTTTAGAVYSFNLTPDVALLSGYPGEMITYTLRLTNTSNATDTFDLSYAGNAWSVQLPVTQTTLGVGAGQAVYARVTIPPSLLAGSMDVVTVTAVSQGNGALASVQLTTTAIVTYGMVLATDTPSQSGIPGATVPYTLYLTNTSNAVDVYTVTLAGNAWQTVVTPTALMLTAQTSATIQVSVTVPVTALAGMTDAVSVIVTSYGYGAQSVQLITSAGAVYSFSLTPDVASQSDHPGKLVTYTLQLTNTSNVTDTFNLTNAGNVWTVTLPVTQTALGIGVSQTVYAVVAIPAGVITTSDMVTVTATSQGNGAIAPARLTTVPILYKTFLPVVLKN